MWEQFLCDFVCFFETLSHISVLSGLVNNNEVIQGKKKDIIILLCSVEKTLIWNCNIMPTVAEHNHHVPEIQSRLKHSTNSMS